MDWMPQEQERGITITSAATTAFWKDHRVNTTPQDTWTSRLKLNVPALDGAITVLDAQSGVEPQTENVWRQATTYGVPVVGFRQQNG